MIWIIEKIKNVVSVFGMSVIWIIGSSIGIL